MKYPVRCKLLFLAAKYLYDLIILFSVYFFPKIRKKYGFTNLYLIIYNIIMWTKQITIVLTYGRCLKDVHVDCKIFVCLRAKAFLFNIYFKRLIKKQDALILIFNLWYGLTEFISYNLHIFFIVCTLRTVLFLFTATFQGKVSLTNN